jgi:hypothetical protein
MGRGTSIREARIQSRRTTRIVVETMIQREDPIRAKTSSSAQTLGKDPLPQKREEAACPKTGAAAYPPIRRGNRE